MEMKTRGDTPDHPTPPPPYSPPQSSSSPAVILVPPAANVHGGPVRFENTSIPTRTVVTTNIIIPKRMAPVPTPTVCHSCNNMVVTRVDTSITAKQHLFALLLCGIGFWPCVFIPYIMSSCAKSHHYCPICNSYIGTYS